MNTAAADSRGRRWYVRVPLRSWDRQRELIRALWLAAWSPVPDPQALRRIANDLDKAYSVDGLAPGEAIILDDGRP